MAKNDLTKVHFNDRLKEIQNSAFINNSLKMSELKLNEGLKIIETAAFKNNIYDVDITLPSSVVYYGNSNK